MFLKKDLEETVDSHEKRLNDIESKNNFLSEEINNLFVELNLTPQQVSAFVNNPDNFSEENWLEIQQLKQRLDQMLKVELDNIRNPTKSSKAYASRKDVAQHWLYVR